MGKLREMWNTAKKTMETKDPALVKKFTKGLGPALDSFETRALSKIKKGTTEADYKKAAQSEAAKVKGILTEYAKFGEESSKVRSDVRDMIRKLERALERFPMALASGHDHASAIKWAT